MGNMLVRVVAAVLKAPLRGNHVCANVKLRMRQVEVREKTYRAKSTITACATTLECKTAVKVDKCLLAAWTRKSEDIVDNTIAHFSRLTLRI